MRRIKKICNIMFYIVLAFLILSWLNNIVSKSRNVSSFIGFRTFVILTGSMEPEIIPGDVIVIRNLSADKIKEQDIITYKLDSNFITHRVIGINEQGFITKGDSNDVEDSNIVEKSQLIGKKVIIIPKLGYAINFLSRPLIKSILIGILVFFVLLDFLDSRNKKIKEIS